MFMITSQVASLGSDQPERTWLSVFAFPGMGAGLARENLLGPVCLKFSARLRGRLAREHLAQRAQDSLPQLFGFRYQFSFFLYFVNTNMVRFRKLIFLFIQYERNSVSSENSSSFCFVL